MTVYIVDIESVESRYTGQWKTHVPELLISRGINVQVISGPADIPAATTPGAFLNFGGTNVYKSSQIEQVARLFCTGTIKSGDHFLFTDAWHPGIINVRYMSELLQIPVTIHALWHAGSYDPHDFLGRLIGAAPWVRHAEQSFFYAIDHNYFATEFHIKMFERNLLGMEQLGHQWAKDKVVRSGWPMEYMEDTLSRYKGMAKRDLLLFPHRIAPEKQVEIFRDLSTQLPQYEFIVCQDRQLSKGEYHSLLGQSKIVFSASLQETLGIGCYEGAVVNSIPMVPDRLSYTEMYDAEFRYPSEWTLDWEHYIANRTKLCDAITQYISNYDSFIPKIEAQSHSLRQNFFSCDSLINILQKEEK